MAELSSQVTSIQTLYAMFSEGKLFVNRRYQRKLVWTLEEKQKLIDSIQKQYPIPAILIAEREEHPGTYEIIDGLQRLHTIISFIETSFAALDGRLFDIKHFPTAQTVSDEGCFTPNGSDLLLSQREIGSMLNYNLAVSYMRGAKEEEINDVFDRINTYGHRLSDQERRQAGVQNDFSNMVRKIACTLRGDESFDILPLRSMPSISIDLPMTKHGYEVRADEVFWVKHGVLRATDLRDSMDEQCIADIAASVVGGTVIDRSKDALDDIYKVNFPMASRINNALTVYGGEKFADEFKYCIDEILKVCAAGTHSKLRELIFKQSQTNAFPSVFAIIFFAFHEMLIRRGMVISDYEVIKSAMHNIAERIERGRKATSPEQRTKNVDSVRGVIEGAFVRPEVAPKIYCNHSTTDIDAAIRRSSIELSNYELKQGLLTLDKHRKIDKNLLEKVLKTICAIANNGPNSSGRIIIGVTDKDSDAKAIEALDGIEARCVGNKKVVGVEREVKVLKLTTEKYLALWTDAIRKSPLTPAICNSVLSNIDFNSYFGLGLIIITVPPQREICYYEDDVYWRNSDSTVKAASPKDIVSISSRFS